MSRKRRGTYVPGQNSQIIQIDSRSLENYLEMLGGLVEKAVRPAAQAGAKVIYELAQQNAAKLKLSGPGTGNLYGSVYQKYVEEKSVPGAIASYHVSWRTSTGSGLPRAPHAHLIEYGWIQRYQRFQAKDGHWYTDKSKPLAKPKHIGPKPFMRDAIIRGEALAVKAMEKTLIEHLRTAENES